MNRHIDIVTFKFPQKLFTALFSLYFARSFILYRETCPQRFFVYVLEFGKIANLVMRVIELFSKFITERDVFLVDSFKVANCFREFVLYFLSKLIFN